MPTANRKSRKRKRPGRARAVRTEILTVHGPRDPDRVLTVDFDAFVDALAATPDPRVEDMPALSAGADLLLSIMDGDLRFEKAAPAAEPAAPTGADLADRILGLTDDAFEYAHRILEQDAYNTYHYENEEHQKMCESMEATLKLLDHSDDDALFEDTCRQLLQMTNAQDAAAARELL